MTRASGTKDRSYKLKYAGQVPNSNYLNTLYKRWLYNAHNSWAQHVLYEAMSKHYQTLWSDSM